MTAAICHPDRPMQARGYCNSCYTSHIIRGRRQRNGRYYQHTPDTKLESAIARYGTPHKAAEKTSYPFEELWRAWQRMEAACLPVQKPGQWRKHPDQARIETQN